MLVVDAVSDGHAWLFSCFGSRVTVAVQRRGHRGVTAYRSPIAERQAFCDDLYLAVIFVADSLYRCVSDQDVCFDARPSLSEYRSQNSVFK